MTSGQSLAKKEDETNSALLFIEAYQFVSGQLLQIHEATESPDFICRRPSGELIGIELTKIMKSPEAAHIDWIYRNASQIDPYFVQYHLLDQIQKKELVRRAIYSAKVDQCLLVFQLLDGDLRAIARLVEEDPDHIVKHGFTEIWIADYSGVDSFGNVELLGLHPRSVLGIHRRQNWDAKPFG